MSESQFRLALNADVCATTKMAEGINAFVAETLKLEQALRAKLWAAGKWHCEASMGLSGSGGGGVRARAG